MPLALVAHEWILSPIVRAMERSKPSRTALRWSRCWRSHRDGSRPRVLCVGYLKTGTTSFGKAMRQLGYAHYGYDRDLAAALRGGDVERCLAVAERFDSLDDWPWSMPAFVAAFQQRFPNSRYVLLERDEVTWLRSYRAFFNATAADGELLDELRSHHRMMDQLLANEQHVLRMNICAGDGYEKLCPFLGLPVPDVPFAWANKSGS
ncbi:MAG: sulfotransferase [Cyanobacteriota bacterium]|nr:sulfotransferase [Cyanobacteriota bacterium]